MKDIIFKIIKLFSRVFPWGIVEKIQHKWIALRSQWISGRIEKVGQKVYFLSIAQIKGGKYISIGNNSTFGRYLYLTTWTEGKRNPNLEIGNNCSFGDYNHITCFHNITIGDNVLTGKWVTITDNSHGNTDYETLKKAPSERNISSKGPVIINKNVWIGDKVTILPNVTIGEGSVIGANSVVTKNIPPFCIAGGNPAKILKVCFDNNQMKI